MCHALRAEPSNVIVLWMDKDGDMREEHVDYAGACLVAPFLRAKYTDKIFECEGIYKHALNHAMDTFSMPGMLMIMIMGHHITGSQYYFALFGPFLALTVE